MTENPFNPLFGRRPNVFIGRDEIEREFLAAQDNNNSPWRSTLLIGMRGSGKTALLTNIREQLPTSSIVVYAAPESEFLANLLGQIYKQLPQKSIKILENINSFTVAGFGLGLTKEQPSFTNSFRYQISLMLDELKKDKIPVIFLIDEVQKHSDELRTFISNYQQLISENYDISLVMAGLPQAISDLLNDNILTFFRRANRIQLGNLNIELVKMDYQQIFLKSDFSITKEEVEEAALATQGYPYLIQLVGYYLWENLKQYPAEESLQRAKILAQADLFQNVHEVVYNELSAMDQKFLKTMAEVGSSVEISEISKAMGKKMNYISNYRARLIEAGVIEANSYGKVSFTLPYMHEFIKLKDE
ncbi:MAG: ATP-binding protein [Streptococcaceae bacterium]|jgi:Holliday junction resolvasome RuvABC ATP-dependent DNA helicase subunit|nr:ATP-binding protein [Streptococcaceae bacterium]